MRRKGGEQRKVNHLIPSRPQRIDTPGTEVGQRIAGREEILERVCELAQSQAAKQRVEVKKVGIRPAWSHEYDEKTGVVVDVDVVASNDERFSYWEALGESLAELADTLPSVDANWLQKELSLTVIRS